MGCGFINVVDSMNRVFVWGDNYGSQLGTRDDIHRNEPIILQALNEHLITQISLGFQHGLYLTQSGKVFGVGKNTRFQLGHSYNKDSDQSEIFDRYQTAKELLFIDEEAVSVHAGKFHSIIRTASGKLYGMGYNKYGQLGLNNSLYLHAEEATEIFTDNLEIDQIAVGAHHCLILGKDGELYGFGARMNG